MTKISEMSNNELIKEAYGLYDVIYVADCYGTRDMLNFGAVCEELERRGFVLKEKSSFIIEEEE